MIIRFKVVKFLVRINILPFLFDFFPSLPYKSHPPVGYLIAWLIETVSNCSLALCLVPLMCHTISACWLIISFIKDIAADLEEWNNGSVQNQHELKVRFRNTIQLYSNVKELSTNLVFLVYDSWPIRLERIHLICFHLFRFIGEFNATSEYAILIVFTYILLNMCSTLLVFMSLIVEYTLPFSWR